MWAALSSVQSLQLCRRGLLSAHTRLQACGEHLLHTGCSTLLDAIQPSEVGKHLGISQCLQVVWHSCSAPGLRWFPSSAQHQIVHLSDCRLHC